MSNRVCGLGETVCPVCGKIWFKKPENVYKERINGKLVHVCCWTCLNKLRKENKC